MKLKHFMYAAMLGGMLVSCSSEDGPVVNDGNGGSATRGDGYLAVKINLPQTPSTRAANDNFADGTANEYAVNNGMLVLFSGANETDATYLNAYSLTDVSNWTDGGANNDNLTVSKKYVVKVDKGSGNLYGLVMLNYDTAGIQYISASETEDAKVNVAGTILTTSTKFSDFQALQNAAASKFLKEENGAYSSFFMTNAPITTSPGDLSQPSGLSTLANLNGAIYSSKEQAESNPAASIYVERGVAKATLSNSAVKTDKIGDNEIELTIQSVEWVIDNTEKSSYIVRNFDNSWLALNNTKGYRMAGSAKMGTTTLQPESPLYRTYFAKDPTYAQAAPALDVAENPVFKAAGNDKPQYCFENTFTVDNMNYKNTTRALLKVTFNNGQTFYSLNGNREDLYLSVADIMSGAVSYLLADKDMGAALKAALGNDESWSATITNENYEEYFHIVMGNPDADGIITVTDIVLDGEKLTTKNGTIAGKDNLIAYINNYYKVTEYTGGVAYYAIRFKHFGDELTPWTAASTSVTSTEEAYGNDAAKYLGRWGMVRNNWYDIAVTAIKNIGEPVPSRLELNDTPDDNKKDENWISFTINVLSWAKRTQNETL